MNLAENIIGIDLGGTNMRSGKVVDGKIIKIEKEPTPATGTEEEVLEKLFQIIDQCIDNQTESIGVGVPSVVDVKKGIVYDVVNIPSWKVVPLKEILENRYKVPTYINNDANCFALGEKYFGKATSYKNIVGLTIGTGLGSGLIFNDKLYEGINCCAGEVGNISYKESNIEHYCSGQFFSDVKGTTALESFNLASKGDKDALALFAEFGSHLGQAIKSVLYAYDPEIIIFGGSLSKAYDFYKDAMFESISNIEYRNVLANLRIEISELENSAIYGAAALYLNDQSRG